jgi:hypothetical protein
VMVPGGEKGDVHLHASMGLRSQMIPEKIRESGPGSEVMIKLHPGSSEMLLSQQNMVSLPFAEHSQQEHCMGPGQSFPCLSLRAATVA